MLGLEHEQAVGNVFNIGPREAVDTDVLVQAIADVTGYEIVKIKLDTLLPYYETSVKKAIDVLGFTPFYVVEEVLRS
jgi:nucleoside-diphosphate-sugar epimerase